MLSQVWAGRFVKKMEVGRTSPCLIECQDDDGTSHELVVKYSHTLMEGKKNLAMEAIVAMLASDLGLPIAEPFLVQLDEEFIATVGDPVVRQNMSLSCPIAFGSRLHTGFAAWPTDQKVPTKLTQVAADILIFDEIIENWDRRPTNPNCMYADDQLLIIDHELAFQRLLFWKEPWHEEGLKELDVGGHHIFAGPYFETPPTNFARFISAWEAITDERFDAYKTALPQSWVYDEAHIEPHIDKILSYLKQAKANIRTITANALKVLT